MSDAHMAMADGGPDDLPRTFRRERDAQREAREREARERAAIDHAFAPPPQPPFTPDVVAADPYAPMAYSPPVPSGIVTSLEIPFPRLVLFFLKALFAALPAIILLGVMLWCMGQILTNYFPVLLKMKILITFPN